ncbi:alpha-xylosidase [Pseudovirgaria hyperparasitica]|uniref:alpha-glucosidase n=1 Tax=Pseudovirgaria hyperparasitica TaxID=470096 RepID=A0A6A6W250_9PEZI|nr:alpha-xylosidase [Pseudovirgaria hyperparasitica]KAF2756094.1 alpha-xylosidase [Pseudovirgaria hyperparasitica]
MRYEFGKQHRYSFHTEPVPNPEAVIQGDKYRFTILTDGLIRLEWAEDGKFEDRSSTFALNRKLAVPKYYLWDHDDKIEIVTTRYQLFYDKKKFGKEGLYINLKGDVAGVWAYGDEIKDLGGTIRTLDMVNGRGDMGHGIMSRSGFGRINDTDSFLFEKNGWVGTRQTGNRSDEYLFCYGHDYKAALQAYYAISGSQPLLPRYALGNWWTRYHKYTSQEYLELMDHFRADEVPFAILVIDIYWHKVDLPPDWPGSGWTGFTWDRDLIPDPVGFLKQLKNRDLYLTVNDHPAEGVRWFEELYDKVARHMGVDPSTKKTIEFDSVDRRFMDAYLDIICHQFEREGIDFWWVDWQQGEHSKIPSIDPLWMLNHYHFLDNGRNNHRPLILSRFAGPGSHRYQVGFSGDVLMTWESLNFQPEFTATATNIGYGWWSHDIGGHMQGYKDDELQTRWYQLGCFSPILRLHCNNNMFNFKEPWKFGPEYCAIMEDTLRFRHRLVPYLYTMNHRAAVHDIPLIHPIYYEYPDRELAYKHKNSFYYGSELLVAPCTSPRAKDTLHGRTDVWLPPDRWVDIFTGLIYDGERDLSLYRLLSQVPALAKQGAIIPLDAASPIPNGVPNPQAIEIILVVGADGAFTLIEDDGNGEKASDGDFTFISSPDSSSSSSSSTSPKADDEADARAVEFSSTPIKYEHKAGVLSVGATTPMSSSIPASRSWSLKLLSHTPSSSTSITAKRADGRPIPVTSTPTPTGTKLLLGSIPSDSAWSVSLGPEPSLDVLDATKRCYDILINAWGDYDWKQDVYMGIAAEGSLNERIERTKGKGVQGDLLGALLEGLQADSRYAASLDGKTA